MICRSRATCVARHTGRRRSVRHHHRHQQLRHRADRARVRHRPPDRHRAGAARRRGSPASRAARRAFAKARSPRLESWLAALGQRWTRFAEILVLQRFPQRPAAAVAGHPPGRGRSGRDPAKRMPGAAAGRSSACDEPQVLEDSACNWVDNFNALRTRICRALLATSNAPAFTVPTAAIAVIRRTSCARYFRRVRQPQVAALPNPCHPASSRARQSSREPHPAVARARCREIAAGRRATRPTSSAARCATCSLGVEPKDFDVATNATPEEVRELFRRSRIIGRRFQHRARDVRRRDRRSVHLPRQRDRRRRRRPTSTAACCATTSSARSEQDAARRDFTVNALYYDPSNETVIDYHDGVADLQADDLRMIGDPSARYREDPVRMLRAVRFAAKLGLTHRPEDARADPRAGDRCSRTCRRRGCSTRCSSCCCPATRMTCLTQLRNEGLHHGLLPLLDVILEQPLGERFVMLALDKTDSACARTSRSRPAFLFAALLWHEVLAAWESAEAPRRGGAVPALLCRRWTTCSTRRPTSSRFRAVRRRHEGDLGAAAALRAAPGQAPLRGARAPALSRRLRFPAAARRERRGRGELGEWWTAFRTRRTTNAPPCCCAPRSGTKRSKRRRRRRGSRRTSRG